MDRIISPVPIATGSCFRRRCKGPVKTCWVCTRQPERMFANRRRQDQNRSSIFPARRIEGAATCHRRGSIHSQIVFSSSSCTFYQPHLFLLVGSWQEERVVHRWKRWFGAPCTTEVLHWAQNLHPEVPLPLREQSLNMKTKKKRPVLSVLVMWGLAGIQFHLITRGSFHVRSWVTPQPNSHIDERSEKWSTYLKQQYRVLFQN